MTTPIRALIALAALAAPTCALAASGRSAWMDERVAFYAARHGVPERLVHRIIVRESRYQPHLVSKGNYGLMQIKPATARGMGYAGAPSGLLDPEVNLTYAVPYLANAWRVAGGSEDRAVSLYAGGYYYVAKRRGMLAALRTARSTPLGGSETVAIQAAAIESSERAASRPSSRMRSAALAPTPQRRPAELAAAGREAEPEAPAAPPAGRPDIVRD